MKLIRQENKAAFTLLELLLVFGIMVLVAGLVVGLSAVASEKKKISRTQVERERLVTLIEMYRSKVGMYPPQNPDTNALGRNTLIYELLGCFRDDSNPADPLFITPLSPIGDVRASVLAAEFGVGGVINASSDRPEVKRILKNVKPSDYIVLPSGALMFVAPFDGTNGAPNLWNYAVKTAVRNKGGFDLWADIYMKGKTNYNCVNCLTIGNWKD